MSVRGIFLLGVVTLVALTAALLLSGPRPSSTIDQEYPLVSGLADAVNAIDHVRLHYPDGESVVDLYREGQRWRVRQHEGFEADFENVAEFLRGLAQTRRIDERTSSSEWHGRLGLQSPGQGEGAGLLIEFPGSGLAAVILGNDEVTGRGQFVRDDSDDQAWLTDRRVPWPQDPIDWLQRSVMDIPASELSAVTIVHPDGQQVLLRAADDESEDWVLMNVPDGREAVSAWQRRAVANGLADMRLDAVAPALPAPDNAVRALFVTRDGLNFVATLFRDQEDDGSGGWVQFEVSAEHDAGQIDDADNGEIQQRLADAAAVDQALSPWRYRLNARRFDPMVRTLESLLVPLAEAN